MATWVSGTTTSSGGNISLTLQGGYGTVTRNGTSVSFPYGMRFTMSSSTWSTNGFCAWLPSGGTKRWAKAGSTQSVRYTYYYANGTSSSTTTSETTPVTWSGTLAAGVSSVNVSIGTAWNATNPTASAYTYTFTVPVPVATAPSGSISVTNNTRTSATLTSSVSSWGSYANAGSAVISYGTSTSYGSTATSGSGFSVNPNTTYYYRLVITNNADLTATYTGNFTTPGNAPSITSTSVSSITRTGGTIGYNVTYDTNASYSSRSIEYGLTTGYGSSTTNNVLTGLNPNTLYYYRIRVTDNWSRTSSWYTGSFTTSGNIPTISSTSVTDITPKEATILYTDAYDTNAFNWLTEVQYGLTISYGQSKGDGYLVDLTPASLHYYRVRVQDNWGRYSSWSTGTFTTLADSFVKLVYANGTVTDTKKIYLIDEYGVKTEITKEMFHIIT